MTPSGTLPTLLTALLISLLTSGGVRPSLVSGGQPVSSCRGFTGGFCARICAFKASRKTCCQCFGECCDFPGTAAKRTNNTTAGGGAENDSSSERSPAAETVSSPLLQVIGSDATDERGEKKTPAQLVLSPKNAFLPVNFESSSAQTTASTSCVEPGYPDTVRASGSIWYSLARQCQVLKCRSGVIEVALDNCKASSTVTTLPPWTTTTAAAKTTATKTTTAAAWTAATTAAPKVHWSSHYYPCTDPKTGIVYQHGETWTDLSINCLVYRCMNGTEHVSGFNCATPAPEPEPDVPGLPAEPDLPEDGLFPVSTPKPTAVPWTSAPTPTAVAWSTAATQVPPLQPRPNDPDVSSGSCVDDFGQVQASGNTWSAQDSPCVRYHCEDGVVRSAVKLCSPPPPGCSTLPLLPGQCCASVTCPPPAPRDCTFDGRGYRSGDVFADNPLHPCQQHKCDDGLVVALNPPIRCQAVYCSQPRWPEGACCRTCPHEELPAGLDELKQLLLKMGVRLSLPSELMLRLEESVSRLVAQLAALLRDSDQSVTLETLVNNLIETTDVLNSLATGVADASITSSEVLLSQLRTRLVAIVDQLKSTLTDDQIHNASIDIDEFIAWLRAFRQAERATAANILMNDLTRLFSGLLMEPGCTDAKGTVHAVDTLYVDDPGSPRTCFVCANLSTGVAPLAVMNVSDCGGAPPPGCTAELVPNSCCPRLQCTPGEAACRDDFGELHPHGSKYVDDPKHPCVTFNCSNGVATIIDKISCMAIPSGCTAWKMDGFCCPKSDCPSPGCVHEGRQRDHGTTWPQDPLRPCVIHTCVAGTVTSEDRSRQCRPPPASHCVPRLVDYQCCPQYDCVTVNCTYNGRVYREGETWSDDDRYPCRKYSCTRRGTEKVQDLTGTCEAQPHAGCTGHRVEKQCCKVWICPQCEHGDRTYSEGDIFWDDPSRRCAQMMCRAGQTVQLTPQTECPPVPPGCIPNYSGTSCCHFKYTCPSCMFDPQGNFIRMLEGGGV